MGHVAYRDGGVAVLGTGDGHHRGVLEIVIVAAEPEAVLAGFHGLETGAVDGGEFSALVCHLGAFHLDGEAFADAGHYVVQQF